ncbi:variable large family protein [Borreliella burgdorferi]|uniref:variable large family protein n=1 Tax=Borreliella burgdorferi TaxID=139 RepID=UPI002551406F|nr:variable large family protein [Borreliella burgdorferi]MDK7383972.1 variable large family protein [Borreliella burgdorferi]
MVKAATEAATAASGGKEDMIGKVVKVNAAGAAAKGGDATSVNGIASGIKGIVAAAEKAGEEGKLKSEAAGDGGNENAGKLFAKKKNDAANGGGDAAAAEKAAAAVSAVSGKQILKAIVDAAEKGEEKKGVADVKDAKNPIEAAIGSTGEQNAAAAFDKDGMKKNDQIAAAIVLRGMAKDGEFALKNDDADKAEKGLKSTVESAVNKTVSGWLEEMAKAAKDAATAASGGNTEIGKVVKVANAGAAAKGGDATSVNGIASGIKGIVAAAEKAGEEGKLKSEAVAAGEANADAGKLFAKKKDNDGGGDAAAAEKAAAAVSAVSGKQILKAIVDAAEKGDGEKKGVKAEDATNPIDAAIGSTGGDKDAAAFDKMKKNDQIAAAIVLRGMAKDGEFALKNDDAANAEKGLKSTVESAVNKTVADGQKKW